MKTSNSIILQLVLFFTYCSSVFAQIPACDPYENNEKFELNVSYNRCLFLDIPPYYIDVDNAYFVATQNVPYTIELLNMSPALRNSFYYGDELQLFSKAPGDSVYSNTIYFDIVYGSNSIIHTTKEPLVAGRQYQARLSTLTGATTPEEHLYTLRIAPGTSVVAIEVQGIGVPAQIRRGRTDRGIVSITKPAPEGGLVVSLQSSNPSLISVPSTVTIPSGRTNVQFPIRALNANTRDNSVQVIISASYKGSSKSASTKWTR